MSTVRHTASFEMAHPIAELFPLFSPEGEKRWVPGWTYENIMGGTELHEDYVFVTGSHDHAATDAIWLVKKYRPAEHLVQFYKVEPGEKVGIVEVACRARDERRTEVRVTYEYIGLSESGNEFIAGFTADDYGKFIAEWETLLVAYLDGDADGLSAPVG